MCRDRKYFHLKDMRCPNDRIRINVDSLDFSLPEVVNVLVAKKGQR